MATTPFATFDQACQFGSGNELFRSYDETTGTELMVTATEQIEDRCDRRLAAFTGLVEEHRAEGVDQDILGQADMPLDLQGALGYSQALAFASTSMVRDFWLDQWAPRRPELWTYTVSNITLYRAYGDTQIVDLTQLEGPWADTGRARFHLGIFCPVGTTIAVTYAGGYTAGTPAALTQASILEAMKIAIIGAEAEARKDLNTDELEAQILKLIAPYIR